MIIRRTDYGDLPAVMEIINAAKRFFRENGIDQWQRGTPNEEMIKEDIKNGESYVAEIDGKVCATVMISLRGEPTYRVINNGKWLNDGSYGVLHRIAVSPDCKKSGIATAFVKKAEEITREAGFLSLRADTHNDNKPMRGMLTKNGFTLCGGITLADGSSRWGFEKIIE